MKITVRVQVDDDDERTFGAVLDVEAGEDVRRSLAETLRLAAEYVEGGRADGELGIAA